MTAPKDDDRPTLGRLEEIEFKEGRYFSQIWHVGGADKNWLAAVWKDPSGPWTITCRLRYFLDNKAHGSADERVWYETQIPGSEPEERVLAAVNSMAKMARIECGAGIDKLVLRTADIGKIRDALAREDFMHFGPSRSEPK